MDLFIISVSCILWAGHHWEVVFGCRRVWIPHATVYTEAWEECNVTACVYCRSIKIPLVLFGLQWDFSVTFIEKEIQLIFFYCSQQHNQSAHKMPDTMHKAFTVLSKGSSHPWSQFTFKATLFRKDLMLGKDWGQEKKGATEDEMVRWHHWLSGHKLAKTQGDNERQGSLVFMESQRVGHSNWTTTLFIFKTALKWSSKRYLAFFKVECFLNWKRDW